MIGFEKKMCCLFEVVVFEAVASEILEMKLNEIPRIFI